MIRYDETGIVTDDAVVGALAKQYERARISEGIYRVATIHEGGVGRFRSVSPANMLDAYGCGGYNCYSLFCGGCIYGHRRFTY